MIVPVSGGGMIGGIATAIKAIKPECLVIAAEPHGKSLQVGSQGDISAEGPHPNS